MAAMLAAFSYLDIFQSSTCLAATAILGCQLWEKPWQALLRSPPVQRDAVESELVMRR